MLGKNFNTKYRGHTDPNGRYDQNKIKLNKGLNCFGLQYKPSSGAEWKKIYVKRKPLQIKSLNKNT